jgi:hypothetical protein
VKTYGIFERASPYLIISFCFVQEEDRELIQFPKPITEELMRSSM